jgi:general secretion pathway protein G
VSHPLSQPRVNSDHGNSSRSPLGFIILLIIAGGVLVFATRKSTTLQQDSQINIAQPNLKIFESALDAFEIDNNRYPTTVEGLDALVHQPANAPNWRGPYLKSIPRDPWGVAYLYQSPGAHNPGSFDISSAGADKTPDTADDIGNW